MEPELVIADEPVASLDVSVRAQILEQIRDIRDKKKTSFLFISHDLSVVRLIADRVAVMKDGHMIEVNETEKLFENPREEYTRALIEAVPVPNPALYRK